jgi:serine/threonine-protein kinase HipA
MLEALLLKYKLDRKDYFGQLIQVGNDLVGAVTVHEV